MFELVVFGVPSKCKQVIYDVSKHKIFESDKIDSKALINTY